jgi:hypothetical protein
MRLRPRRREADPVAELWQTEMDYYTASVKAWASGRPPGLSRAGWRAGNLNSDLLRLQGELEVQAGELLGTPVNVLAGMLDDPDFDVDVTAAAALQVVNSDVYRLDGETLQPGAELPAVGWWARLEEREQAELGAGG